MALSPERKAQMDAILQGGLTPERRAAMDAALGVIEQKGNDAGAVNAAAYGLAGAVPFGNVITSGLGAGIAKIGGADGTLEELYDQAQADTKATEEGSPIASLAGNVAGIAVTLPLAAERAIFGQIPTHGIRGAVNAIPKGLSAIGNFVRGSTLAPDAGRLAKAGNLALRSAKSAAVAAPTGAIYGAGSADAGERLEGAKRGAGVAAAVGAAVPVAGAVLGLGAEGAKNLYRGATARSGDALEKSADKIHVASSKAYGRMREIGATFTPQAKAEIEFKISKALLEDGPLNKGLHGSTMSVLRDMSKAAMKNDDFSLEQLDQYRRLLGRIPRTNSEDVRKASIAIDALDGAVDDLTDAAFAKGGSDAVEALNLARGEYHRFSKFDRISNIINESGGDANKIKSALQRFANNPKKTRGFSKEEISAINAAAKNSTAEGLLKMAGKFGIDLGSSLSVGNAGLPALTGALSTIGGSGGTGAAVVAGGTAARQAQKWLARGKAESILRMIEEGGKAPIKEIMELPPSDAQKIMQYMKLKVAPQVSEKIKTQ